MNRWLLRIGLLLALGAIVNVAVAWGFGIEDLWEWRQLTPDRDRYWTTVRAHGCEWAWPTSESRTIGGQRVELDCWDEPKQVNVLIWSWELGFPLRSVAGEIVHNQHGRVMHALLYSGGEHGTDYAFAFRPIWPGFAINTLFYAGVLWLLFAAPLALRRRRRIKRGLCPKCAYPVGTNERCTECGARHEVKPRSAAS